jgi:hypothetical protein
MFAETRPTQLLASSPPRACNRRGNPLSVLSGRGERAANRLSELLRPAEPAPGPRAARAQAPRLDPALQPRHRALAARGDRAAAFRGDERPASGPVSSRARPRRSEGRTAGSNIAVRRGKIRPARSSIARRRMNRFRRFASGATLAEPRFVSGPAAKLRRRCDRHSRPR